MTRAPRRVSFVMVGRLARIRPSSVITGSGPELSSGTFRSARTRTRRPATSRSSMLFMELSFLSSGARACDPARVGQPGNGHSREPTRVTPLIVVRADDLDLVTERHGKGGIEGAGIRRAHDVG